MSDQRLLNTYDVFEYQVITEVVTPATVSEDARGNSIEVPAVKKVMMKGVLQKADTLNQNGRIYPAHVLEREVRNYQKFIIENRALGELDHPDSSVVNLKNVSHIIREAHLESGTVVGTVEVLDTPSGKILQSLVESGIKLGISSRGVGSTRKQGDYYVVQDDFQLICWDYVSEPSTPGAFMIPEGKKIDSRELKKVFNRSDRIDRILNDILFKKLVSVGIHDMTNSRINGESGIKTLFCKFCKFEFTKYVKASHVPSYCSRSCASKSSVRSGLNCFSKVRTIVDVGNNELANRLFNVRSQIAIERNTGRLHSQHTKDKISTSCTGKSNALKGLSFEQFYGADKAKQLSDQHSQKLLEGYASGRLKPTARMSKAPTFRGIKLRSQLEQRAIEFLEKRDNLIFCQSLLYEHPMTRVQWFDNYNKQHTYTPDLFDAVNNKVYEVKPSRFVDKPTDEMIRKMAALSSSGWTCEYLTEKDMIER